MTITAVPRSSDPQPTPAQTLGDLSPEALYAFARGIALKIRCADVLVDGDDVTQELWLWASALAARRPSVSLATARKAAWREGARLGGGKTPAERLGDRLAGDPDVAALRADERRALIRDAQARSKRSTSSPPRTIPLDDPVAEAGLARLALRQPALADMVAERLDDRARLLGLRPHIDAELEALDRAARVAVAWRIRRRLHGAGAEPRPSGAGLARSARVLGRVEARVSTGVVGACPRRIA